MLLDGPTVLSWLSGSTLYVLASAGPEGENVVLEDGFSDAGSHLSPVQERAVHGGKIEHEEPLAGVHQRGVRPRAGRVVAAAVGGMGSGNDLGVRESPGKSRCHWQNIPASRSTLRV